MEKRKHRFNVVDVVVLLLIAAALALVIFGVRSKKEASKISLTYVMQTLQGSVDEMIPEEMASNVQPGDDVFDAESGQKIGTVASCDSTCCKAGWTIWKNGTSVPAVSMPEIIPTTRRNLYLRAYFHMRLYAFQAV